MTLPPTDHHRSPRQIAGAALSAAKAAGIIKDYSLRKDSGRATIYFRDGSARTGKTYTTSALDTLYVLRGEGFDPEVHA